MNYNTFIENTKKIESVTCGHCEKVFSYSLENPDIEVITRKKGDESITLSYNFITQNLYYHEIKENKPLSIDLYLKQKENTLKQDDYIFTITQKTIDGFIISKNPCKKINDVWYCAECVKELFCQCENCNDYFDENILTEINGENFCDDCMDDLFYFCENCNEYFSQDDAISVDDKIFCSESCANKENYYKCADCGTWYNSEREGGQNTDDENICDDCAGNYYTCDDCGNTIHSDNMHCENDSVYCEECFNALSSHLIHDYSFMPKLNFNKLAWENTLYLGLEFEFESDGGNIEEIAENINNWLIKHEKENAVYLKKDSSLENGIEIVFHPHTLKALHKNFPLKGFIEFLQKEGLSGFQNGRCGFHIHVSKNHFKNKDVNGWELGSRGDSHKLKLFFYKCKKYLKTFSKRKDFHYCQFPEEKPIDGNNVNGRYEAVNTATGKNTIEFRLFRSTNNYTRILASIQFADAISYYIVNTSFNNIDKLNNAELWQDFLSYCKKENRYNQFIKYILLKKII